MPLNGSNTPIRVPRIHPLRCAVLAAALACVLSPCAWAQDAAPTTAPATVHIARIAVEGVGEHPDSGISRAASMGAVFGGGGLLLMPVLIVTGAPLLATPQAFTVGAYMALVPMFLGYLLFGYGLTKVPVSTATTVTLTEPAIATLLAVLIVGEHLGMLGWTGLAVIAIVLVILAFAPANADHHPPAASSPSDMVAAVR